MMAGVLQQTLRKMTDRQIEFICDEFRITEDDLMNSTEEELDGLFCQSVCFGFEVIPFSQDIYSQKA